MLTHQSAPTSRAFPAAAKVDLVDYKNRGTGVLPLEEAKARWIKPLPDRLEPVLQADAAPSDRHTPPPSKGIKRASEGGPGERSSSQGQTKSWLV
jgi:hypothetical protein